MDTRASTLEPPAVQGWFHHGAAILALLEWHRPAVCVELGTWQGASAIPVARSIRRWGGTLTCVDTWAGDLYTRTNEPPWMLVNCARNLIEAGVGSSVRLVPATTVEASAAWIGPIDYLYIDADHSELAVEADLHAWWPHVRSGGLIVGDDYGHALFPGVQRAWDRWARNHDWPLTRYQSTPPHADGIQLVYGIKP